MGGNAVIEKKLYRLVCILFVLGGALIAVYHIVMGNGALALLGPVSWLFLLIPPAGEWLLRLKLGYPLKSAVILFCFMGFSLGTGLRWHDTGFYFDDISHFFSGILFALIGFCLYDRVVEEKPIDRRENLFLQATYAFFFSMFVAVIWEIGEYAAYLITGHDVQHTLTTGVHDTMQDIIACFLGTILAALDYFLPARKGKKSILIKAVDSFDMVNQFKNS